jgi:hypothetical protein
MRPAHVHFMVSAPGHATLITHVFVAGDEHLDSDAVFGVKASLIAPFERHEAGVAPDGRALEEPWYTMHYDLVLAPASRRCGGGSPVSASIETDVLIVGTGPAGGSAAVMLSTYGIANIVVTKYGWTANTPRAHITNQRALEIMRDLGLQEQCERDGTPNELMGDTVFCHEPRRRRAGPPAHLGDPSPAPRRLHAGEPLPAHRPAADLLRADPRPRRRRARLASALQHRVPLLRAGLRRRHGDRPATASAARRMRSARSTCWPATAAAA